MDVSYMSISTDTRQFDARYIFFKKQQLYTINLNMKLINKKGN